MASAAYIDVTDYSFVVAVLCIVFNPLFWNVVARWEHKTRVFTRLCGSPYTACYSLGAILVLLAVLRSHCFAEAIKTQPKVEGLLCPAAYYTGMVILALGALLVVSSFFALGFVGTYLGMNVYSRRGKRSAVSLQRTEPRLSANYSHEDSGAT